MDQLLQSFVGKVSSHAVSTQECKEKDMARIVRVLLLCDADGDSSDGMLDSLLFAITQTANGVPDALTEDDLVLIFNHTRTSTSSKTAEHLLCLCFACNHERVVAAFSRCQGGATARLTEIIRRCGDVHMIQMALVGGFHIDDDNTFARSAIVSLLLAEDGVFQICAVVRAVFDKLEDVGGVEDSANGVSNTALHICILRTVVCLARLTPGVAKVFFESSVGVDALLYLSMLLYHSTTMCIETGLPREESRIKYPSTVELTASVTVHDISCVCLAGVSELSSRGDVTFRAAFRGKSTRALAWCLSRAMTRSVHRKRQLIASSYLVELLCQHGYLDEFLLDHVMALFETASQKPIDDAVHLLQGTGMVDLCDAFRVHASCGAQHTQMIVAASLIFHFLCDLTDRCPHRCSDERFCTAWVQTALCACELCKNNVEGLRVMRFDRIVGILRDTTFRCMGSDNSMLRSLDLQVSAFFHDIIVHPMRVLPIIVHGAPAKDLLFHTLYGIIPSRAKPCTSSVTFKTIRCFANEYVRTALVDSATSRYVQQVASDYDFFVAHAPSPERDVCDAFTCPVSLQPFRIPVIASDSHTYEMDSLLHIVANRSLGSSVTFTSPLTRESMRSEVTYNRIVVTMMADKRVANAEYGNAPVPIA